MHNVVVRDIPCYARSDMSAYADVRDVGRRRRDIDGYAVVICMLTHT